MWLVAVLAMVGPATAAADPDGPWKAGVSEADQQRANALFDEANKLFGEQAHAVALDKYRAAISIWDHPVIRFNMAVTLVRLDRMLEAADALDAALRFGKTPFTDESYAEVLDYRKLVQGRVGEVEASCSQADAYVVLDGKRWFGCPGTHKTRVLVGEHTVTGEHPSLLARPQRVVVSGGVISNVRVDLQSYEYSFSYERRFQTWVPWTVTGAGAVLLGAGILLQLDANSLMDDYDRDVAQLCAVMGCDLGNPQPGSPEERLVDLRERAESRNRIALVTIGAGAITAAAGVVLLVLNRPTRRPIVNATVSGNAASATVGWSF